VNGLSRIPNSTLIDPAMPLLTGPKARQNAQNFRNSQNSQERDIALSFRFNANASRVFYALSIPEYIETWLKTPHLGGMHFVFNLVAQETFRADLYCGESIQAIIHGTCRVVAANQARYLWKTTGLSGITETLVDMKLLCDSAACVLALKHSGFKDTNESLWYRAMWQQSLERLGRLMEKN
jgi:uncharacterized protein YndB with AHSA1/START domain